MAAASRADDAFNVYVELGPGRSLAQLAEVLRGRMRRPPSLRTLESWSTRFGWQERLADIDRKAREEAEQEHVDWVRQHRKRLRDEGLVLQQRGLEWLRAKRPDEVSANEGIRAIDTGFKLEALALGEATERISVEEHDERLERLSDDELNALLRAARHHETGGTP